MARDKGFGRKKKNNKKVATEVAVEVEAGGDVEVPDVKSQRQKKTRLSRKKALPGPTSLQPPACTTFADVEDCGSRVQS